MTELINWYNVGGVFMIVVELTKWRDLRYVAELING